MRKKKLCKNTKSVLNNENGAYKLYHNFYKEKYWKTRQDFPPKYIDP